MNKRRIVQLPLGRDFPRFDLSNRWTYLQIKRLAALVIFSPTGHAPLQERGQVPETCHYETHTQRRLTTETFRAWKLCGSAVRPAIRSIRWWEKKTTNILEKPISSRWAFSYSVLPFHMYRNGKALLSFFLFLLHTEDVRVWDKAVTNTWSEPTTLAKGRVVAWALFERVRWAFTDDGTHDKSTNSEKYRNTVTIYREMHLISTVTSSTPLKHIANTTKDEIRAKKVKG